MKLEEISRNPIEALEAILLELESVANSWSGDLEDLSKRSKDRYSQIQFCLAAAKRAASYLTDEGLKNTILSNLEFSENPQVPSIARSARICQEGIYIEKLDKHFEDADESDEFNISVLTQDEKAEIRELFASARKMTMEAKEIPDQRKRRIIHFIHKAENELAKDKSTFSYFMAAAYEVSDLTRKFGNDVQPIAEAVEKARTITEKKVTGSAPAIESEKKPKALPSPKD